MREKIEEGKTEKIALGLVSFLDELKDLDYDYIFSLTKNNLVYVGDRNLIRDACEEQHPREGLKKAIKKQKTWKYRFSSLTEMRQQLPEKGRIALFTTHDYAQELVMEAQFDEEAFNKNRMNINGLEVLLMANLRYFTKACSESIFYTSPYEFMAERLSKEKKEILDAIIRSEGSLPVKLKEQLEGIEKKLDRTGRPMEETLFPEEIDLVKEADAEKEEFADELNIYKEYLWWKRLRDKHFGLVFTGTLDHESQRSRQEDWKKKAVDAYCRLQYHLRNINYDMFLQIEVRRGDTTPDPDKGYRRVGIGNRINNFGNKKLFAELDFNAKPLYDELERFYEEKKHRMGVHLFRGHLLKTVLDKILPSPGGRVVIDTSTERVYRLAQFCKPKHNMGGPLDNQTLIYNGVELIMLNREAITAMHHTRRMNSSF